MKPLHEWRRKAQYFDFAGRRIANWVKSTADSKPWLLLIHGFPTSSWDWSGVWTELSRDFNLAALDMLGFGLSDKPANIRYSILDQADLQEALLERLGVSEAHILAHDYGDTVAQELLARARDGALSFRINSVVLLNGGLFPEQHRPRPIQKLGLSPLGPIVSALMTKDRLRANFDDIFGPQTKPSSDEINAHWTLINENHGRRIFHKLLAYIPQRKAMRTRWVGAIQDARAPVRLIVGGADPVSGRHLYDYYREQVPDADAVLFEDIGHYPQTEAPGRLLSAFREFHARQGTLTA